MDVLRERKSDCPNINMYKHCRGLSLVCEYAIWNMMYSSLVGILVKWPHDCCALLQLWVLPIIRPKLENDLDCHCLNYFWHIVKILSLKSCILSKTLCNII